MSADEPRVPLLRRLSVASRLLFTFAFVAVGPVLATGTITGLLASASAEKALVDQAEGMINQTADAIAARVGDLERKVVRLSYSDAFQLLYAQLQQGQLPSHTTLEDARNKAADEFDLTTFLDAVVISVDGDRWVTIEEHTDGIVPLILQPDVDIQESIYEQGGRSVFSSSYYVPEGEVGGVRTFTMWRQAYDSAARTPVGLIGVTVKETYVSSLVHRINSVPGSRAFLSSTTTGRVVSNVGHSLFRPGDRAPSLEPGSNENSPRRTEIDGELFEVLDAEVINTDLVVSLLLPVKQIYGSSRQALSAFMGITAVSALGAFAVAVLVGRSVNKPIRALARKIEELEDDPDRELTVDPSTDEIGTLDRRFNTLIESNRQRTRQREQYLRERRRMQLEVLQAQVSPHYMTNALTSIINVVSLGNVNGAVDLTKALRATVNRTFRSGDGWSTLGEEIEAIHDYSTIASFRTPKTIHLEVDLPDELRNVPLPTLTLQPLVENAYVHAFQDWAVEGRVSVVVRPLGDDFVEAVVRDNGRGIAADPQEDPSAALGKLSRFGIRSVRERLALVYGNNAEMNIKTEPWIFTEITLMFPREVPDD